MEEYLVLPIKWESYCIIEGDSPNSQATAIEEDRQKCGRREYCIIAYYVITVRKPRHKEMK